MAITSLSEICFSVAKNCAAAFKKWLYFIALRGVYMVKGLEVRNDGGGNA